MIVCKGQAVFKFRAALLVLNDGPFMGLTHGNIWVCTCPHAYSCQKMHESYHLAVIKYHRCSRPVIFGQSAGFKGDTSHVTWNHDAWIRVFISIILRTRTPLEPATSQKQRRNFLIKTRKCLLHLSVLYTKSKWTICNIRSPIQQDGTTAKLTF